MSEPDGMDIGCSRREFIGGAAAFAVLGDCLAAAAPADVFERKGRATDSVFCRRLYLDACGRLPLRNEVEAFVAAREKDKHERLAETLLASGDYADYWSMRFCDILRVKSEFPINLWPNAVYVYHRRIRRAVFRDEPWDAFARTLLTALGSNFRVPEANFLRATPEKSAAGLSRVASETFLLAPTDAYARYFSRVAWKSTREWKEEIVYLRDGPDDATPEAFADLLAGKLRAAFVSAAVRRVHWWLFGAMPDERRLADWRQAFERGGLRLKPLLRHVFASADYRAGPIRGGFPARRLDAEVLDDAICSLTGARREYGSVAPEPFTFLPERRKSVLIEDGSITSSFLLKFGRPARDTGALAERDNRISRDQRLYLFNSSSLWKKLGNVKDDVAGIYLKFLSRPPTSSESHLVAQKGIDRQTLAWYLVNSREFLYRL